MGIPFNQLKKPPTMAKVYASKRDAYGQDYNGELIDEDMIVLRKRIHEMRMAEMNYEPPSDWMEWEKKYGNYDSDVCEGIGLLQSLLMNTRPGLALGVVVLMMLCVPTSMAIIMFHLVEIAKGILAAGNGIHP